MRKNNWAFRGLLPSLLLPILVWVLLTGATTAAIEETSSTNVGNWSFAEFRVSGHAYNNLRIVIIPTTDPIIYNISGVFENSQGGNALSAMGNCFETVSGYFCTILTDSFDMRFVVNNDGGGTLGFSNISSFVEIDDTNNRTAIFLGLE